MTKIDTTSLLLGIVGGAILANLMSNTHSANEVLPAGDSFSGTDSDLLRRLAPHLVDIRVFDGAPTRPSLIASGNGWQAWSVGDSNDPGFSLIIAGRRNAYLATDESIALMRAWIANRQAWDRSMTTLPPPVWSGASRNPQARLMRKF